KTDVLYGFAADWHQFVNNECTAKVTDPSGMIITGISNSSTSYIVQKKTYNITFAEEGLPAGFSWTVNFKGTNYSTTNKDNSLILTTYAFNTQYQFYNESYTEDGCNLLYRPYPSSGSYNSVSGNVTVTVQYYAYSNSCTPFTVETGSRYSSLSFKFTVPSDYSSNNLVLLETSGSAADNINSVTLPPNCQILNESEDINGYSGVFSAVCIEPAGSYYINTSSSYSYIASAAYILNGTDYSLASNMTEYTGYSSEQLNSTLSKLYPMTVCNVGAGDGLSVAYKTDVLYGFAADWHQFVNNECTAKVTDPSGMIITGISNSSTSYTLP
ncbi:hypothetical protein M1558_01100, partial [Candidatus Parvarchaeota archaeon]|nr:hypothetical protein [Candidatus Parvarchaeota archaeon]